MQIFKTVFFCFSIQDGHCVTLEICKVVNTKSVSSMYMKKSYIPEPYVVKSILIILSDYAVFIPTRFSYGASASCKPQGGSPPVVAAGPPVLCSAPVVAAGSAVPGRLGHVF